MRTVRVPPKPVVLIAVNSHEMPAVPAGLDQSSPCPARLSRRPAVVIAGFFEGQYEPAPLSGVTRRCICRCNLLQPPGVRPCRRARPRGTMVPPGRSAGLGDQAELACPGDGLGAVARAELAQQVAD